jgi:hypothetical protein
MMANYYPQEYIYAAEDQGGRDYHDGVNRPPDTYPQQEKDAWSMGWNAASDKAGLYDDVLCTDGSHLLITYSSVGTRECADCPYIEAI